MEYNYLLNMKKERRGKKEKSLCFCAISGQWFSPLHSLQLSVSLQPSACFSNNLKAKFARPRCKSLKRNSSLRFDTTSFSLVHSREKLWSVTIFRPLKKKEEGRKRKAYVSVSFFLTERPFT